MMKSKKTSRPVYANRHRKRMWGMQVALLATLGIVAVRIQFVQHVFGPRLLSAASQVQQDTMVSLAPRGALLDSSGHQLAYDVPAYMFDIKTSAFAGQLPKLANELAPILNASSSVVLAKLQSSIKWAQWPMPILEPAREQIVSLMAKSSHSQDVTFTSTEERFYPYGNFAANTLGYVNQQGVGMSGLEYQYNSVLGGKNGKYTFLRDGAGFPIQSTMKVLQPAVPGQNVELTLNQTVQGFVENAMNNLDQKYKPKHAAIIVMNPQTGAILGMASRPTYNPNQYWTASAEALNNNWAVNSAFEPGSTFKVMVLAAALATHSISLNQTFKSGTFAVDGSVIHDWNYWGWGTISFLKALEYSSNVGFATIATRLGWSNLLHYMKAFGYLGKTGIDLPGEATSIIFPPSLRGPVQLATSGFGQGIAVTPLEQMAAVGAIANGGKLMKPYLAKAFINPQTGKVVKTIPPTVVNPQVVPQNVAQEVSNAMVLDVSKGIDNAGYLKGYDVAGKTGTAQVVDPKTGQYYTNRYIVSFIGYAPGWDPQVEVYVTVDSPNTKPNQTWGSTVSTPYAREILKECLQYYHISPKSGTVSASVSSGPTTPVVKYEQTPDLIGKSAAAAASILKGLHLTSSNLGGSGTVQSQWPAAGVEVPLGATLYYYSPLAPGKSLVMPNLKGTSMREAGDILAAMGLSMLPGGSGFAVSQSIPAGRPVQPGTTIRISFQPPPNPTSTVPPGSSGANPSQTGLG